MRSDLPPKIWRSILQRLLHPAECTAESATVAGVAACPGEGVVECPGVTFNHVKLLASAAQSQPQVDVDVTEDAQEGSIVVSRHCLCMLCICPLLLTLLTGIRCLNLAGS